MPYDLTKLAPDEKDRLLHELLSRYDNDVQTPGLHGAEVSGPDHGDESADRAMLEPVLKVLDIIIEKLEELEARIEANEKLVVDDLFGGIDRMYKNNLRTQSINGIQEKYGSLFDPHMDALKELAPDENVFEALHEMLDPLRREEGWDDEKELGHVTGAAQAIADKIAKIRSTSTPEEKPAGVAVEITRTNTSPEAAFLEKVKGMRKIATAKGL